MTKIFSGLLFIFFLGSCYPSAPEIPFDMKLVITADSMVTLLTDLHTADGIITLLKDQKKSIDHLSNEYFEAVLQKHMIDRKKFEESMRYYAFHTEDLNEIYERVIINLSKKESLIHSEIKADTASSDTLP